jgi:Cu(I)/Ag(I) efflux system membrane fusion protein
MNRPTIVLALIAVLLTGVALGFVLSRNGLLSESAQPAGPGASGARRVLYWHDPMVPNVKFDKPGKSPYMEMQLVPVYADDATSGAAVHVSPAVAQNLGIRLGTVEETAFSPRLSAIGSVAFDERLVELVQARAEGYITKLYVKAPFEEVRRDQPLAQVLSPAWKAAQEEYLALLDATSERGRAIQVAARQRLTVLGIPDAAIAALERDRKVDAVTTLRSPIDGVVSELAIREGAAFTSGAALFQLNGMASVWVNAHIPETQVSLIEEGSSVTARAQAWPGESFDGRVLAVLPQVDPQTRTLTARIELDHPARKLAPGMFVTLDFEVTPGSPRLVVPSEAVIMTGERNVVIVARDNGGFDAAEVKIGPEAEGKTAILSGLTAGQSIVLSGQFLIDSEASLRSTVSRLSEQPGGTESQP